MAPEPDSVTALLEAAITGFSVLGGVIVAESGSRARRALLGGASDAEIGNQVNRGIAEIYDIAVYGALLSLIMVLFT